MNIQFRIADATAARTRADVWTLRRQRLWHFIIVLADFSVIRLVSFIIRSTFGPTLVLNDDLLIILDFVIIQLERDLKLYLAINWVLLWRSWIPLRRTSRRGAILEVAVKHILTFLILVILGLIISQIIRNLLCIITLPLRRSRECL